MKFKIAILIFVIAAAVRIFYVISVTHTPLENDAKDYDTLGIFLSQGKGYVTESGVPTAYRPPIYPLFLGATYFVASHELLWVRLVQSFLGAGICVLIYLIAIIISDETTAKLSGALGCFYPAFVVDVSQIRTETFFTFLLLLIIWLIISRQGLAKFLLSGLVLGLSLLTRPFIFFFLPLLFYWLILRDKFMAPKAIALLIAGVLVILTPWTIRNYYRLDAFVPLANVGGITLYNSYVLPQAGLGYSSIVGLEDEYYEIDDETERNKFLIIQSIEYIVKNPVNVFKLAAIKLLLFIYPFDGHWYPVSFGSKYNIFWGIILGFSVLGIFNHYAGDEMSKKLIYFLIISYLVGTMVFYGSPRFRFPIEPFLICFAAVGLVRIASKKIYASSTIVFINVLLFIIFRYFKFQGMFSYFRSWI